MKYKKLGDQTPIHLAFLGSGKRTAVHAKLINGLSGKYSLSFASRSLEKAQDYQKKYKGTVAFGSYQDAMLSSEVDVIVINTPPDSHYELAKYALQHDKHVIVEKPPFFKSSEMEELGQLADSKGLQLIIAENYYYKPLRYKLESLLASDIIGQPLVMNINAMKEQDISNDWRENLEISGGGALFEGGIHWVNFVNNLGFQITSSRGYVPDSDVDFEKTIQIHLETNKNLLINLFYSWEVNTIFKGLRLSKIYGTKGSITFESNGIFIFVRGTKKKLMFPDLPNITGTKPMWIDFLDALKTGNPPQFSWKMANKDLKMIENVYQSVKRQNA